MAFCMNCGKNGHFSGDLCEECSPRNRVMPPQVIAQEWQQPGESAVGQSKPIASTPPIPDVNRHPPHMNSSIYTGDSKSPEPSRTAIVFYIISILSLIGGIMLAYESLPGDPGEGRYWKPIAYQPSIIMFTIGFVQASLFTAVAKILTYLKGIEFNTRKK
jgi:hypothetical protein